MIEAFRVGAVARGKTLWEGLDLALGDGEIWVVAGPPSCGKTVLMNILRGERRPDLGDVVVGGESVYKGSPDHNRRFRAASGVVPEAFPAGGGRTVEDMFRLSALAAGEVPAAERRRRTEELLSLVGLPGAEEAGGSSPAGAGGEGQPPRFRGPLFLVPGGRSGDRSKRRPIRPSAAGREGRPDGRKGMNIPSLWWIDWSLHGKSMRRETIGRFLLCFFAASYFLAMLLSGGVGRFLAGQYPITPLLRIGVPDDEGAGIAGKVMAGAPGREAL